MFARALADRAAVMTSHPPLFGFSACMSLIGFAYGMWIGALVGSIASLIGAALAWFSIRVSLTERSGSNAKHFFLDWMRKFGSSKNKQWEAFGCVMRDKGWPLVAMIRWCPLPWAIGNGLFAVCHLKQTIRDELTPLKSIEGVEFWHYMVANVLFLPRLCIPVFIGSRLNSLSDDKDAEPDPLRFWLNLGSIALSLCLSVGTGALIYRLTLSQMRKMQHPGHPDEGELAAEAFESTALLGDFSDEEVEEELVPQRSQHSQA